jgi:uridine kinase
VHVRVPDGSGEPVAASWTEGDVTTLLGHLEVLKGEHPAVVAVDGRSGAGKSTLARRLVIAVPDAALVATDDVAWHFSMFDWTAELVSNVIVPVRRGQPVRYRPPGWITKNRPGAVTVEASCSLLIVEGVGSSRRELTDVIDAAIWVQSDVDTARQQGIERDIASGVNGDRDASIAFWDEWAVAEECFLEYEAPWSRANVFVAGVPLVDAARLHWWIPAQADRQA